MSLLENSNLLLRAIEPEDLSFIYQCENDSSLWEQGSTLVPLSHYALKKYIENSHLDLYEIKQMRLMITLKSNKNVIGMIDLFDFDPYHNRAAVGIMIDREYQNQGYATQSLQLLIAYSKYLKIHQLYVYISVKNITSFKLFKGVGFSLVGCLKEWKTTASGYEDVWLMQYINS